MTNSQESDSIAEKPEVVKTKPKSNRWNWKTAIAVTLTAAVNAVSLGSVLIQPIRRRINQWNWRQKTAYAQTDGWRYRNREYLQRNYYYGARATRNGGQNGHSVDAQARANQLKTYDTSGTDSSLDPTSLYPDEVLDEVSDNANLTGRTDTYKILEEVGDGEWDHLYTDTSKYYNVRQTRYYTVSWGGYVKKPTDAEIQAELDQMQEDWNNARTRRGWQRPIFMGRLKLGERTTYKKIKLWSKFEFNRIPGDTDADPKELQTPGDRSIYVTELSYIAREAGYNGSIVTKVPENETPFFDYPKPKSHVTQKFMPFDLTKIEWENFQIIGDLTWTGSAKRYYRSKFRRGWCTRHKRFYRRSLPYSHRCYNSLATRYEYKIFQNESVEEPSN